MWKRIFADIVLFISVFFAPWYAVAGLGVIFIIIFPRFWEAAAVGIFLDAIYYSSQPGMLLYGRFGLFTALALILIIAVNAVKKRLI